MQKKEQKYATMPGGRRKAKADTQQQRPWQCQTLAVGAKPNRLSRLVMGSVSGR